MEITKDTEDLLQEKIAEWMKWDKNEKTLQEIKTLVDEKNDAELQRRLLNRMEFGTAGLRSRMGAGYNMMNDLTIIQTTQGFAAHMLEKTPEVKSKGVVIGYDARHNSSRFAQLAATVFLRKEIPVYLYSKITPTPYVPYGVVQLGCCWGIMVTASHNPKEDNGYKVYNGRGAQIISPDDQSIASCILCELEPWEGAWDTGIVGESMLCRDPYAQMHTAYMRDLTQLSYHRSENGESPVKFTYTAMHGVGYESIQAAFQHCGFQPPIPVKQQVEPDPEFPTVEFPNPEEGKSALDLSMRTAEENDSTVILANDPDADRLAIAERKPDGQWHVFSGNEIGAMLGWWLLTSFKKHNDKIPVSDLHLLSSTVSSKILRAIAKKEGCNFTETLTGFKWMGNYSYDYIKKGKTVVFAFEEAIGFMCGSTVLDKDGVSAAVVAAEMASQLALQGVTLYQQLHKIYSTYGYHVSSNSYFICRDPDTINAMFARLRDYKGTGKHPEYCGKYKIKYVRDLTTGYDNSQPNNVAILPVSKSSHMITFTFENGCVATIRTSGTEPKIKYYTEFCADPTGQDEASVREELAQVVKAIIQYFYEPERNGLKPRST